MYSLEVKVQLAPIVVNTIQKRKWLYRLRDHVLGVLSLPVTFALILKIFSFCGCREQFYIIDWARKVTGGLRTYFFETPLKFFVLLLYPRQPKLHPLEILQNCVTSLGNSTAKNKDPWKFHMIFFWSSLDTLVVLLIQYNIYTFMYP